MDRLEVDGARLHVAAEGQGRPVLLVHATGTSVEWLAGVMADLRGDHRVIAFDRRGFGSTGGSPVRDIARHAADAAAVLERHAAEPALVVGWSSGGTVAAQLALARPELVAGLVLAEPSIQATRASTRGTVGAIVRAKALQARRRPVEAAESFERWASGYKRGGNAYDALPGHLRAITRASARSVLADLDPSRRGAGGDHVRLRRLAALPMPITLIEGSDSDPWFDRIGDQLRRAVPHLRIETLPGAGHYLPVDDPAGFAAAVRRAALATAPAARRTPSPA